MMSPKLRLWHLFGLIAAIAAFMGGLNQFRTVHDPAYVWSRQLRSTEAGKRLDALEKLKQLGPEAKSAFRSILEALNDIDPRVRKKAVQTLQAEYPWNYDAELADEIKATLTLAIHDPDIRVRHAAALALSMLEPELKVVIPTLIEILEDDDPKIRFEAIFWYRVFAGQGNDNAFDALLAAIRDRDPSLRLHAIQTLEPSLISFSTSSIKDLTATYFDACRDKEESIRKRGEAGIQILLKMKRVDSNEFLRAMSDPSCFVRKVASAGILHQNNLNQNDPVRNLPYLIKAMADPKPEVRKDACFNLFFAEDVEPEERLPALRLAMKDKDPSVREAAQQCVAQLEAQNRDFPSKTMPKELANLNSTNPANRLEAIKSLGGYGPRSRAAVPVLIELLKNDDPMIRTETARTLGRIGPAASEAIPVLTRLATDEGEHPLNRLTAKAALTSIRDAVSP